MSIPQDTTAALGDQAILNCSAMAIPTAEYDWTRDGVEWEPDGVRVWRDIGSLVFNRVIREDSGSYICTASNVHGRNPSDPAKLDVTGVCVCVCRGVCAHNVSVFKFNQLAEKCPSMSVSSFTASRSSSTPSCGPGGGGCHVAQSVLDPP